MSDAGMLLGFLELCHMSVRETFEGGRKKFLIKNCFEGKKGNLLHKQQQLLQLDGASRCANVAAGTL